jgi:ribosomal protein S18 acetylase RimI-like enzyme
MTVITLRASTPADREHCYQLHKAAMGEVITALWGWDEQVQRDYHDQSFSPGNWQIVTADGADAGVLCVDYRPTEIYLARIEIHPRYQGQGIGAELISRLLDEAGRRGQDLVLDVFAVNHRAKALYERLGLREVDRQGEGGQRITMRSVRK